MRVIFPAKARDVRPSVERKEAKVTLQLVVNTGNIQIMKVAYLEDKSFRTLVDLERDFVKWMRRELHMDMKNPYSPAIRHVRGHVADCPNTNSQVQDSEEYSEAITAVANFATNFVKNFSTVNEADSWRCCRLNLAGNREATMTRTGRNLRNKTSGVGILQCSERFLKCFHVSESIPLLLSLHTCEVLRKRRRVRIAPYLSCFVACLCLFFLMWCTCCVDQSLDTVSAHLNLFLIQTGTAHGFAAFLQNQTE